MTDRKAIECAKALSQFCSEQSGCQKCVFRKYGSDSWRCLLNDFIQYLDTDEIERNYNAKRKNYGYF